MSKVLHCLSQMSEIIPLTFVGLIEPTLLPFSNLITIGKAIVRYYHSQHLLQYDALITLNALLLVVSIIEGTISVISAVLVCKVVCCCNKTLNQVFSILNMLMNIFLIYIKGQITIKMWVSVKVLFPLYTISTFIVARVTIKQGAKL